MQQALLTELGSMVNRDLSWPERIKGFHTTQQALDNVLSYEPLIHDVADRYQIPAAYIETIMFREQRFYDFLDVGGDLLVQPLQLRSDSSTGVMQIKSRTAIDAINFAVGNGIVDMAHLGLPVNRPLSKEKASDRTLVWKRLRDDPAFNIEVAALNILTEAKKTAGHTDFHRFSEEDAIRTLARYNGTGDDALEYGQECFDWLQAFERYEGEGN